MSNYHECSLLALILTGNCSDKEKTDFEAHLPYCPSCRTELPELSSIWNSLKWEMEVVEAPTDLKKVVFERIREVQQAEASSLPWYHSIASPKWDGFFSRRNIVFVSACILLAITIFIIGYDHSWGVNVAKTAASTKAPSQVVKTYDLIAFDANMPQAKGVAWIVDNGGSKRIVLNINGLSPTNGSEAYQLWVIKNGKKYNGGIFRVDDQGSGILIHLLDAKETPFDLLGITLEPNPNGSQPRGKKVLGTVK